MGNDIVAFARTADQLGYIDLPEGDILHAGVAGQFCCARAIAVCDKSMPTNWLSGRSTAMPTRFAPSPQPISRTRHARISGALTPEKAGDCGQPSYVSLRVGSGRIRHSVVGGVHPSQNCLMVYVLTSRLRQRYQLATEQYGRQRSPISSTIAGVAGQRSPVDLLDRFRMPVSSPHGRTSGRRSENMRNICAVQMPMPFTVVSRLRTWSFVMRGKCSNMTSSGGSLFGKISYIGCLLLGEADRPHIVEAEPEDGSGRDRLSGRGEQPSENGRGRFSAQLLVYDRNGPGCRRPDRCRSFEMALPVR